jgi:hypothetical protein
LPDVGGRRPDEDPLALDRETMRQQGYRVVDLLVDRLLDDGPPLRRATPAEMRERLQRLRGLVDGVGRAEPGRARGAGLVQGLGRLPRGGRRHADERRLGRDPFLAAVAAHPMEAKRVVTARLAAGQATIAS